MSGIGRRPQKWTPELDNKLIDEISNGKKGIGLMVAMNMSDTHIRKRLKEMGFYGVGDARKVLTD